MRQVRVFPMRNRNRFHLNNIGSFTRIPLFPLIAVFFFICQPARLSRADEKYSDAAKHDYGDALVLSDIGDARTLVPVLASDSASHSIVGLIFNGLVKYDKNLNLTGDLAESWDIEDDGLTLVFHLRRDVKWHDGKPFTADDVKFTYEKLIDPDVPTPYSGDFEKVLSVEVPDPYTVKVSYKEPFSPGLASWGMSVMPKHILENEDLLKTDFARNPVGTGPYKFMRWKTGERIDLAANPGYFEHRPYLDRIIYRIIPDPETSFLELQTEAIDVMALTPLQYDRLTDTDRFRRGYDKYRYPHLGYTFMAYNLSNEFFSDKRVRQAINYAVDKSDVINGVLLGYGGICTGPFPPESWAYNSDLKPAEYDPRKALGLLKEAGWSDSDGDGWLDKGGKKFEFTVITNQGNSMRAKTAEIIQRRLAEIGIKVHIRVVEWAVFLNEFVNKRRFEAIILGWGLSLDPDCYDIWHSSKTKPGEFNFAGYSNAEVDALLEEGRRTFDLKKRKEIYNRIHEIIYDDQPYLFLYVPDTLAAVHKRFEGADPRMIGMLYNVIDWYVPENKQKYRMR
ncbi:MAG: peptide-binding protein [Candidatus Omnitrophota bacterium]